MQTLEELELEKQNLEKEIQERENYAKIIQEFDGIIENVYTKFLNTFDISDDKVDAIKSSFKSGKVPLNVKTKYGTLKGFFNTNPATLRSYTEMLGFINHSKFQENCPINENGTCLNESDKEIAERFATVFLTFFVSKIQNELESVITETYALSAANAWSLVTGSSENNREIVENITKSAEQRRKKEFGISRGGARKGKSSEWNNDNKVKFFETVNNLPKIKGKLLWKYAYQELLDKDYNWMIVDYLKKETPLKEVPKLLDSAVKIWKGYSEGWDEVKEKDSTRSFEFLHAINLLGFKQLSYSTMRNYYYQGKKLKS